MAMPPYTVVSRRHFTWFWSQWNYPQATGTRPGSMSADRFFLILFTGTGCKFSVGQQLLAWAKAGGNSAIRQPCRQNNVGASVGERGRACA
jgi:hypothetical protein